MARQGLSPLIIALAIVAIIALSVFIYFQIIRAVPDDALPPAPGPTPPPAAVEPEPPPPAFEPPPLDASDEVVRELVGHLSDHPRLAAWLVPENLVRRFVAAVDNVANGESPRPHVAVLGPEDTFQAGESGGKLVADAAGYERYNILTQVFVSADTSDTADLYDQLEPLFDEAYAELGYPDSGFAQALGRAIDHLLAVPVPAASPELEHRVLSYRYADPALEDLSPAQKHLLRMGPENIRRIQAKLITLKTALGLVG